MVLGRGRTREPWKMMKWHTFFHKKCVHFDGIQGNDQNTYSNSYKKLMILRESNPMQQNRGEIEWNSWNPMEFTKTTHFFSQKVCRISEIWRFSTPREVKWTELNWTDLNWTELNSTELNWTELNRTEPIWSEVAWTELNCNEKWNERMNTSH